ncbi:VC0807 family protein [Gluconacetobacter diazotrophicus]|uniref:VC0807 family protein n=1 Tax=Gluconacetobacter diazotrophicus TaxID=33996 RepID=UPI0003130042|nr:VC0807 family protein [Gluconacetobacter diazotrophicus]
MTLQDPPPAFAPAAAPAAGPGMGLTVPGLLREVGLNVVLPWGIMFGAGRLGYGGLAASLAASAAMLAVMLAGLVRRRSLDAMTILALAATLAGVACALWFSSPRLVLVQSSLVTGVIGLVFLVSLLLPRPLVYFLARAMMGTPDRMAAFADRWVYPSFRWFMRALTLAWAVLLLGEAALRVAVVMWWPDPVLLGAMHVLWIVLPIALMQWSIRTGRRMAARAGRPMPPA